MEAPTKYYPPPLPPPPPPPSKLNLLVYETKQTMAFVYGFMTSFVICFLLVLISDPYGHSSSSSSSSSSPAWYFRDSSQNTPAPVLCLPLNTTGGGFLKDAQTPVSTNITSANIVSTNTSTNVSTNSDGSYEFFPSDLQNTSYDESDNDELWDFPSFKMNQTEEVPLSESSLAGIQEEMEASSDHQNITTTSTNSINVSDLFTNSSSQSFASDGQNISSDGTQPIESNGVWDLPSGNNNTVGAVNETAMGPVSESSSVPGVGEETGGLRDEQNITSSTSTSTTYDRFSELYGEYESMLNCDLYDGKWVKDNSYPLYPRGSCPYIDENFNCSNNGRPDSGYESYRWQPKHCNIPRLKGKDILELIRGKRLVIVGDSLNRNMWESLVCILWNSVEDQSRVVRNFGNHKFKDYDCSVEFFWAPFLVQQSEILNVDGSKSKRLSLDVLDINSNKYKDADIIVFNSGAWYTEFKTSNGRNYYQQGSYVYPQLDEFRAYRRGMITWGKWVDANVNRTNTQVFFRGNSATHFGGGKWNSGGRCDWQTKPIRKEKYLPDYPYKMKILESVMKYMKTPIHFLNITRLTAYRKDAHPAAYRRLYKTEKERMDPLRPQDCTHWCLPGVPDTWNEILYAQLLINHYKKHKRV